MEVFRLAKEQYSHSLSASGSPGRWNAKSQFVLYTSASRALTTLELVVNQRGITSEAVFKTMIISISDDDNLYRQIFLADLPLNWRTMFGYQILQRIGSDWYTSQKSLVLKVPSAVIPQEHNYIINTTHPGFKDHVSLVRTENYFWDDRLP